MKMLKQHCIRAVITLADSNRHIGSIYQVCNFKYYGLTDSRTDFYTLGDNGKFKTNPRGATKHLHGIWLPRTRKHRYCYMLDKKLKPLHEEQPHPTVKSTIDNDCCNGNFCVYDERFNEWWTCPRCCETLQKIDNVQVILYDDVNLVDKIKRISGTVYLIDYTKLSGTKNSILANNKFDIVASNTNIGDLIRKYLYNCKQCFTYTSDGKDNYFEDFGKEFY